MKMAIKNATLVHVDEDYIDMELSSSSSSTSSNLFSYSISSPPQNSEFEFQMISVSNEKDSKPSPADDLFYKGKLLPLHSPPRLQMVQKLIENSNNATFDFVKSQSDLEDSSFPFTSDFRTPSESCRVSSEVANPDELLYPFGWSSGLVGDDLHHLPKKPLPKKLKHFWLSQKLKASRVYLKSFFSKSGCSDKSCASAATNVGAERDSNCKECQNKYMKVNPRKNCKNPFEIFYDEKHHMSCNVMKTIKREIFEDDFTSNHRKSFSGVVQRHCVSKASSLSTSSSGSSSSSSSFSLSSAGYYDLQLFKRSISANYELEGSVEGAIAHCKQSQQQSQDVFSVSDKTCG